MNTAGEGACLVPLPPCFSVPYTVPLVPFGSIPLAPVVPFLVPFCPAKSTPWCTLLVYFYRLLQ